jgi:hypothetical protein
VVSSCKPVSACRGGDLGNDDDGSCCINSSDGERTAAS